jgi:hypothetical protein
MNKKFKLMAYGLSSLIITSSLFTTNVQASTTSTTKATSKGAINSIFSPDRSYGVIKGTALYPTNVYNSRSLSSHVDYTVPKDTLFEIHRSEADGWYYAYFGNDYQGWHSGWVKSSDLGDRLGVIKATALYPANVYDSRSLNSHVGYTVPKDTLFEIQKSEADGWYYAYFGNDYQGWHSGWVKSSDLGNPYSY